MQSVGTPALTVQVPRTARYVGGDRFIINGLADAEIHVFVDADRQRQVRRYYWVQMEEYLPSVPNSAYNYDDGRNQRTTLWGETWWVRSRFGLTSDPVQPGSDFARVRQLLEGQGYRLPVQVMNTRLLRLLDDPNNTGRGRRELMLTYTEDMALTGSRFEDFVVNNTLDAPRWQPIGTALGSRAMRAFRVREHPN